MKINSDLNGDLNLNFIKTNHILLEIFKEQIKYPTDYALILDEFKDIIQGGKPIIVMLYKEIKTSLEFKHSH